MNYVFFLGGMDVEMSRIKELLTIHKQKFFCKNLPWNNAKASCYLEEFKLLENAETPVLIELNVDCKIPKHSIIIDPICENWAKSSLFQVSDMIGHQPINIDLFISANDHGGIPAMYNVGASKEDIAVIRQAERIALGITEHEDTEYSS